MNDKKDSFRGITDEEKEALFRGTFDPLRLSSFSEALQGKSSAFKAYLVIVTLLVVFVFVASFAGSLLSIPSIANSTHPADVQIYKLRVFLGLLYGGSILCSAFVAEGGFLDARELCVAMCLLIGVRSDSSASFVA